MRIQITCACTHLWSIINNVGLQYVMYILIMRVQASNFKKEDSKIISLLDKKRKKRKTGDTKSESYNNINLSIINNKSISINYKQKV